MDSVTGKIQALEISLHQPNVRASAEKLTELLHPEFREIGYSGNTYSLTCIVKALTTEVPSSSKILSQHFVFTELAAHIIHVSYLSAHELNDVYSRHAKRTSIWVQHSNSWKMQFHQATPAPPFEITTS